MQLLHFENNSSHCFPIDYPQAIASSQCNTNETVRESTQKSTCSIILTPEDTQCNNFVCDWQNEDNTWMLNSILWISYYTQSIHTAGIAKFSLTRTANFSSSWYNLQSKMNSEPIRKNIETVSKNILLLRKFALCKQIKGTGKYFNHACHR